MTAICSGGGPSSAKPGYGPLVFGTIGLVEALAARFLDPRIVPFATFSTGAISFDLATLCTSDPPADPGMTATDFAALLLPAVIADFTGAQAKFTQLIGRMVWYAMCQCTTGATPAFPAVGVPTPLPVINPTQILPAGTSGCLSVTSDREFFTAPNTKIVAIPQGSFFTGAFVPTVANTQPLPAGATSVVWNWDTGTVGATTPYDGAIVILNSALASVASASFTSQTPNHSGSSTVAIPTTGASFYVILQTTSGTPSAGQNVGSNVTFYCGGAQPGTPVTPCCPPDPTLQNRLDALLAMVTLIQRQLAPFAYVTSTAHAGLTGTGSFAIQGLLGVKVALTTDPTNLGREAGTPDQLFDRGFVTLGTADGYPSDYRLEHNPTIILPPRCSAFTTLGYTLHAGVTATITELLREP